MKIDWKTVIFCAGIVLIVGFIWFTRPKKQIDESAAYRKIDSLTLAIKQRNVRDSLKEIKADSLLRIVYNNDNAIHGFADQLQQINTQLGKTITNINGLNATDLIKFYSNQLPHTTNK